MIIPPLYFFPPITHTDKDLSDLKQGNKLQQLNTHRHCISQLSKNVKKSFKTSCFVSAFPSSRLNPLTSPHRLFFCMTTLDSSSGAESGMDDTSLHNSNNNKTTHSLRARDGGNEEEEDDIVAEGDVELWETFSNNFRQVQSVLDQNRVLIQQVNENHQSKLPDNLTKNVALIQEINGNISKVVSMYSNLSSNFTNVFHQKKVMIKNKGQSQSPEA